MPLDTIQALVREGVQSIKTKSAMQPLLWFCLFVSIPCFGFAVYLGSFEGNNRVLLFLLVAVGFAPVLLFLSAYIFFMVYDRDRLHSEEYQLRQRELDIVETKGGKIVFQPAEVQHILNPSPRLSSAEEKARMEAGDE